MIDKINKKSILFTAGLVLMASVLLTLAVLLFYNTMESEDRFIEMSSLDTMHNLYDSVETGVRETLFGGLSDELIEVDRTSNEVVFKEDLPNTDDTNFRDKLSEFKDFVGSNFLGVGLNITEMNKTLPFVVYPYNLVYTHPDDFGERRIKIYPEAPVDPAMVGYWKFNGDAKDSSGKGNDGTINGAVFVEGLQGDALSFDGDGDYVSTNYGENINPSINPHTYSVWVKSNNITNNGMYLVQGTWNGDHRAYFGSNNGYWSMGIQGSGWGERIIPLDLNWHFITLVFDGSNAKFYLDGDYKYQKTYTSYLFNFNMSIGSSRPHSSRYDWEGIIDLVAIYNRALNDSEILDLYMGGVESYRVNFSESNCNVVEGESDYNLGSFSLDLGGCGQHIINSSYNNFFRFNFSNEFVNVSFGNGAVLEIVNENVSDLNVETTVGFEALDTEMITVETPRETDLINVVLPGYGVKKSGGVRLR